MNNNKKIIENIDPFLSFQNSSFQGQTRISGTKPLEIHPRRNSSVPSSPRSKGMRQSLTKTRSLSPSLSTGHKPQLKFQKKNIKIEPEVNNNNNNNENESQNSSQTDSSTSSFCEYMDYYAYFYSPELFQNQGRGSNYSEDERRTASSSHAVLQDYMENELENFGFFDSERSENENNSDVKEEKETGEGKADSLTGEALYQQHGLVFKSEFIQRYCR